MKLNEHELRTLDRLVKIEAYENSLAMIELERIHNADYVALSQSSIWKQRAEEADHLSELACKITGDLMGVVVEIKLNRKC